MHLAGLRDSMCVCVCVLVCAFVPSLPDVYTLALPVRFLAHLSMISTKLERWEPRVLLQFRPKLLASDTSLSRTANGIDFTVAQIAS